MKILQQLCDDLILNFGILTAYLFTKRTSIFLFFQNKNELKKKLSRINGVEKHSHFE